MQHSSDFTFFLILLPRKIALNRTSQYQIPTGRAILSSFALSQSVVSLYSSHIPFIIPRICCAIFISTSWDAFLFSPHLLVAPGLCSTQTLHGPSCLHALFFLSLFSGNYSLLFFPFSVLSSLFSLLFITSFLLYYLTL